MNAPSVWEIVGALVAVALAVRDWNRFQRSRYQGVLVRLPACALLILAAGLLANGNDRVAIVLIGGGGLLLVVSTLTRIYKFGK